MTAAEQELAYLRRDLERLTNANAELEAAMAAEADRRRVLAGLARQTREAQRRYFKTRAQGDLAESKRLEAALDDAVAEVLDEGEPRQADMFGGASAGGPYGGERR